MGLRKERLKAAVPLHGHQTNLAEAGHANSRPSAVTPPLKTNIEINNIDTSVLHSNTIRIQQPIQGSIPKFS